MKFDSTAHVQVHGSLEDAIKLAKQIDLDKWSLIGYDVFKRDKSEIIGICEYRSKILVVAYYKSKNGTTAMNCIFERG